VVVEAVVDPAVPLLPPHLPEGQVSKFYAGLDQEPDGGGRAREQLLRQRAEEGHDDAEELGAGQRGQQR
jgi:pyruvate dehydrogenase (quinone)